jgi:3-dehydroquinate dehydratase
MFGRQNRISLCLTLRERSKMHYYFVNDDGMIIYEEENVRGYFTKAINPNMFTKRELAVKDAISQIKCRMKEMQGQLKEYEKELNQ